MGTFLFKLKRSDAEFDVSLNTFLRCLSLAEKRGCVPEIRPDFWEQIEGTNKEDDGYVEDIAELWHNKVEDHLGCDMCEEKYFFWFKDNLGIFPIGLRTILACIAFAEKNEIIPKLTEEWWCEYEYGG